MENSVGPTDQWVLVPGTLCTPEVFDPLLDQLCVPGENRRYVVVNAPATGDYDAPLRSVVTGGEIVCGFSLGSLILAHNLNALKKAKAVVLLAANPFRDSDGNRANREAVRDRVLAGFARDWIVENWATMSTDRGDELKNFVASMAEDTREFITAQTELAASRPGAEKALLETALPLVFIYGAEDKMTPPEPLKLIAENAHSAALKVIDGLGHFALLEAPDRVAGAVLQGLKEVYQSNKEDPDSEQTTNPIHAA